MPNPINNIAETYLTHFSIVCRRWVRADNVTALYEISHAIIIIGKPVPNPNNTGNTQFHAIGRVIAISTMVKKYTKRCGQKAIAKKIPNINDQKPLL
jgi:hypothetical protein